MIAKAIKEEHPHPRPLHLTVEHFFKGYPGFSMLLPKIGARARAPGQRPPPALRRAAARARLPRGPQGDREALQDRYRLRRFGRGGFVEAAMRARAPIVPIAVVGAEEAAADLRPGRAAAAADRPDLLPDHADLPALRPAGDARLPAGQVQAPLPAPGADRRPRLRRRAVGGQGARADRRPRDPRHDPGRARSTCSASGAASGSDELEADPRSPACRRTGAAGWRRRSSATRRSRRSSASTAARRRSSCTAPSSCG